MGEAGSSVFPDGWIHAEQDMTAQKVASTNATGPGE